MDRFKNKKVLVTGGARGIGKSIVQMFLAEGAEVFVIDRLAVEYGGVKSFKLDICNRTELLEAIKEIKSLDILVNNAGVYAQKSVEETSFELLDEIIDTNLKGPFLLCKLCLPKMKKGSTIINIASGLALAPEPVSSAYCSSKAGLLMLTKCMALYYARKGIRVNAVLPGPIDTPMLRDALSSEDLVLYQNLNPMNKIGKPEDVAKVVLYLASDDANFVNGASYSVDGGESISSIYIYGGDHPSKP